MKHKLLNKSLASMRLAWGGVIRKSLSLRVGMLMAVLCTLCAGQAWGTDVTFTFNTEDGIAELGISELSTDAGTDLSTSAYTLNGVSMTVTHGGTATRIYNSSGSLDLRIYKNGGTLTFIAPGIITKIQLDGSAVSNFTANVGTYDATNTKWTGEATSVTLTATNTGKIRTITVTYTPTHTLTYSATNGSIGGVVYGTSTAVASGASVAEGGKVTLTAEPADGYEFDSWSVEGTGSTLSSTTTNPTDFTMGTADATVTANFVAAGSATYSVTYNANGATSGSVPTDDNEYAADDEVTVLGNTGSLAKTGCAFSGWNTQADGSGTDRAAGSTFNITANTTLYAKWIPYTITAQSNNNSYGTVELSGSVITATPAEGYTYASPAYTVSSGSATVVQDGDEFTVTPTSDCTVTINFEAIPTHTATFSVNGATTSQDFAEGAAITFPSDPAAISGKSFVGWAEATISGTTNTAPAFMTSATMGNSDVTYYAVFADVTGTTEASWTETAIGSISSSDVIVISNGTYAMNNDGGTSSAPSANSISVSGTSLSEAPNDNLKWNVSGNATDGYTFYPNGTTSTWLYCNTTADSKSNDNIRVGTGDRKIWKFDNNGYLVTKDNYVDRYLSIYNSQDFRGYINTSNGAFVPKLYKYIAASTTYANYCTSVVVLSENAISGINDSYTVDLANNENEVDFSGATATSGATVQFAVDSSTIDASDYDLTDGVLTVTGNGIIVIRAYVDADATYNEAEKELTVTVVDNPVIGYAGETETTAYGTPYIVDEDLIEGGTVSLVSGNTAVATIDGLTITPIAVGSVTITINTAETNIWHAGSATFTLNVTQPAGGTTAAAATETIFEEYFNRCSGTGGNDGSWSGSIASSTLTADNDNWVFANGSGANECAKFGATSKRGSATTPALGATGTLTLSFKAGAWNGNSEGTTLNLSVSVGSIDKSSVTLTKGAFDTFTATITNATEETTITFAAQNASNNRFFLDDVVVTKPGASITATLNASGYATFCSQYPLDFSEATDYSAWQITSVSGETITFSQITGDVKGGTGILLKGTAGETITLTSANSTNELGGNKLYGTLAPIYVTANEYYGLSGQTFVKVNAGTVPAGKALLPATALTSGGSGVKAFTFVFEDEATSIKDLNDLKDTKDFNDAIYNLAGQRLQKMQQGINIVNGKKILR